jgi:beta-alanine--pyruvate transaminase
MHYAANTLENHWMPFTTNRDFKTDPRLMVKAKGLYYWNHKGEKLIDASSGLFCCAAGHGRSEIVDAVSAQMTEMDYTPHFQTGHPSSFELARMVAKLTPGDLNYVFFCNSGSEAVESAIKIALAYHVANGEGQRTRFVSRERAYHGVNIGGVSLSGMMRNREAFGAVMPGVVHLRHTWQAENRFVRGEPTTGVELADDLQRFVDMYGPRSIAACFVEPIAGSTGVLIPPKGYLKRLREICDKNGILLVFDEVITGFGRTGKAFASQSFDVVPDIITMAKALTNGALPMGAVAVSEKIYNTVIGAAADGAVEFFHGYTYSAHPAACAAGIAALQIYEKEGLFDRAAEMSDYFLDRMYALQDIKAVTDVRGYGLLCGIDLAPAAKPGMRGYDVTKRLFERGLHIKFTGDAGICAPALVAEKSHIDEMYKIFREVFSEY